MKSNIFLTFGIFIILSLCVSCTKSSKSPQSTDTAVCEISEEIYAESESNNSEESEPMPTIGTIAGHEYVDLGLPSGTKWATIDMGAETPYDPGDSYQWGAPEPGDYFGSSDGSTLGYNEFSKNISGHHYRDVARKEWGESWRMPTVDEIIELIKSCTWTIHETHKSQYYYLITGPNKNSIIIPMTRVRGMWSSQPESYNRAYCLDIITQSYTDGVRKGRITYAKQNELLNIRPVSD